MKKTLFALAVLFTVAAPSRAQMSIVQDWTPVFKGIDHAIGTNTTSTHLQSVNCMRIDLTDPDIKLFPSPRANNWGLETNETRSLSVSNFIRNFGVKVATDCNFYNVIPGGSDPSSENLPSVVHGLSVCTGAVVSLPDNSSRWASLLFTTSNVPYLNYTNRTQGTNGMNAYTNVPGIFSAVTGFYPILTNGAIWDAATLNTQYPDGTIHTVQPRTSFGISADKHYFFLMIIDGRQQQYGYSDGATDQETATWMQMFGASDAIMMDGGGSTALYKADCAGNPITVGHSSYVRSYTHERYLGSQFGVYAMDLPGFITDVAAIPWGTTATITWLTASNATSQVEYGLTPSYGTLSVLDSTPVTNHSVTLTGLTPGTLYYYRVISDTDTAEYRSACGGPFLTTNLPSAILISLTNIWSYTTSNLDGVNWQSPSYDDQYWPTGPGVLWVDSKYPTSGNNDIQFLPLRTRMPTNSVTGKPYTTYYFRSHFHFDGDAAATTLKFTVYVDDGAVFYLNGAPIYSMFLPEPLTLVNNSTYATNYLCSSGDATCSNVFVIPGDLLQTENTLAVEVHNLSAASPDITLGCILSYTLPQPAPQFIVALGATPGQSNAVVSWATISNSTSQVRYGLTTNYGFSTTFDSTLVTNHSATLSGLMPNIVYYYQVVSTLDTNTYTASGTFLTLPVPPPPFFTNISIMPFSYSATLAWGTISNSSSQVEYGITTNLGTLSPLDSTLVTNHSVSISGLLPVTSYYYRLISVINGTSFSTNGSFTTVQPPIYNIALTSGFTNATISWTTLSNSSSQILYGLTPSLGLASSLDATLVTNHSVALTGLIQYTNYYFRIVSSVGSTQWVSDGSVSTYYNNLLPLNYSWKYSTSNYDGLPWTTAGFNDSTWLAGPALLWADMRPYGPTNVQPKNTRMPLNSATLNPFITYYFRTHFTNCASLAGYALVFSNFIDDGAVFYANGVELNRLRMPAGWPAYTVITNSTYASSQPTNLDAVSADVFRIGGDLLTNFVAGDNLLAVEVHNFTSSPDVTFGSSIGLVPALVSEVRLSVSSSNGLPVISWPGKGFTLQQANILTTNGWSDVPGSVTNPCIITNPVVTTFYRLRN